MSKSTGKRPTSGRSSTTKGDAAAPSPGKRTLVERQSAPEAPVQRKASPAAGAPETAEPPTGLDPQRVHQAAQHGTSGSGGALPHLDRIQRAFGRHDVSGVRAHTDERAAEGTRAMGAEAFANGEQVAFGGTPSLHTAAHEAAHVVQQRGGVQLKGGVGEAGDPYEQHANAVADLVVQGKSAESLLDRHGGSGGARGGAIQRLESNFGKFDTTSYTKVGPAGSETGVDIKLTFDPDVTKVDAQKIGLTQSVRTQIAGTPISTFPSGNERMVTGGGDGDGSQIDRFAGGPYGNPLYAADSPTGKEKNLGDTPTVASWGQHGWAYKDAKGTQQKQIAKLNDTPQAGHTKNSAQEFETAAVAVEGKQAGTYMGSVSWGWTTDGAGKFTQKPLALVSKGNPSKGFIAAAKQWNSVASFGNVKANASPTNIYDGTLTSVAFTIAKGDDVRLTGGAYLGGSSSFNDLTVTSGKETGKSGYAKVNDLKDVGGANPVLKLPIP